MVDTPSPKPDTGASPTPFKRGQIVWSRPPQTVFRVSQPPRAAAPAAPLPAPRARSGSGILNGSMIPRAGPAPTRDALPPAPTPAASVAPVPEDSPAPAAAPEPSVLDIEVIPARAVEPEVVVPSYANTARTTSGLPAVAWIGGAVAVALVVGVAWLLLRPQGDAPATVTPPAVTETVASPSPAPVEAVPVPDPEVAAVEADPVPTPTPSEATVEPATRAGSPTPAPTRPAPAAASPSPAPRPATVPTVPQIETAPLAVAPVVPPTAAEAPAADPDAPIQTRPQPLD